MKCPVSSFFVMAASNAVTALGATTLTDSAASFLLHEHFESFKQKHGRTYASDSDEHAERLDIFAANLERVVLQNDELTSQGKDAIHGINRFSDWSEDEFRTMLGFRSERIVTDDEAHADGAEIPIDVEFNGSQRESSSSSGVSRNDTTSGGSGGPFRVSGSFNWVDRGMTTPVKDQGYCGSCWAFSAVQTVESAWARAGHPLVMLSTQQVVSCDNNDSGCNGGIPTNAFEYVKRAGGLDLEKDYPYTSGNRGDAGSCRDSTPSSKEGTVSEYNYATPPCNLFPCSEDSNAIAEALERDGPISIAIDASKWSSYVGGVMTSSSCSDHPKRMDHAVQTVGYNADASPPYWIVRNSWGPNWGDGGYIYLEMGENTCGIANLGAQVTKI